MVALMDFERSGSTRVRIPESLVWRTVAFGLTVAGTVTIVLVVGGYVTVDVSGGSTWRVCVGKCPAAAPENPLPKPHSTPPKEAPIAVPPTASATPQPPRVEAPPVAPISPPAEPPAVDEPIRGGEQLPEVVTPIPQAPDLPSSPPKAPGELKTPPAEETRGRQHPKRATKVLRDCATLLKLRRGERCEVRVSDGSWIVRLDRPHVRRGVVLRDVCTPAFLFWPKTCHREQVEFCRQGCELTLEQAIKGPEGLAWRYGQP